MELEEETSNFEKINIKKFPKKILSETPENKYWKCFQKSYESNQAATINQVKSSNDQNLIAFCYSSKVAIFNTKKQEIQCEISKLFQSDITGLCFRPDGKLIATGENEGRVLVIDVNSRQPLRKFANHKKAVYSLVFGVGSKLVTGSDDLSVKVFDYGIDSIVRTYVEFHTDYIRSIVHLSNTSSTFLSASYDFKINLFDIDSQSNKFQKQFDHGSPVESIVSLPNGFSFVSVGGTEIKVWDIKTGNCLHSVVSNQKTISAVRVIQNGDRILTSSFDQHIKIFKTEDMKVTHQFKFPFPIFSFDITNDNQHLAVGLNDGTINIRKYKKAQANNEEEVKDLMIPEFLMNATVSKKRLRNYQFFYRGVNQTSTDYDVKFSEKKQKKLQSYEQYLKKFQYKNAFLSSLKTKQSDIIFSILQEIIQRGALNLALKNFDEEELKIFLQFLLQKINNPKFNKPLLESMKIILDLYEEDQLLSVQNYLKEIHLILQQEIQLQAQMLQLEGCIDTILNCNSLN